MKTNGQTPSHEHAEQEILRNDQEFSRTLEAAEAYRDAEHKSGNLAFTLGDVLIEECGPPGPDGVRTGSKAKLVRAQEFLAQNAVHYSVEHLRDLRRIAAKISPVDRSPGVSVTVYRVARNAEDVEEARKFANRDELAQVTVADVKKYIKKWRDDQKVQKDKKAKQEWENANPGKPRPDDARVSASEKFLATTAQVRALLIKVEKEFERYPDLNSEELAALDAMLRVPLRILEAHEGHDFYTGEHPFWNA